MEANINCPHCSADLEIELDPPFQLNGETEEQDRQVHECCYCKKGFNSDLFVKIYLSTPDCLVGKEEHNWAANNLAWRTCQRCGHCERIPNAD